MTTESNGFTDALNAELVMHIMLDCIIDNELMNFAGTRLPRSVMERLAAAVNERKIRGSFEL